VLDPIDGTAAFLAGRPLFGTLIALVVEGWPVLGVIDQAVLGERWVGVTGQSDHAQRPAGPHPRLRASWRCGAGHHRAALFRQHDGDHFMALAARTDHRRMVMGGDCYNYAMLATGQLDLVCEANLKLHDYAALVPWSRARAARCATGTANRSTPPVQATSSRWAIRRGSTMWSRRSPAGIDLCADRLRISPAASPLPRPDHPQGTINGWSGRGSGLARLGLRGCLSELPQADNAAFTKSAARSPIMIEGALVLPETSRGMIEASATHSPSIPRAFSRGSTTLASSRPSGRCRPGDRPCRRWRGSAASSAASSL
jgi:hypothetical protein